MAERFRTVSSHDSQQVKPLPEGEAAVTFRVSGAAEMIPWLMSWGQTVEVLEPQWLRAELLEGPLNTVNTYRC